LPLFFGETGHVVCFVVAGFVGSRTQTVELTFGSVQSEGDLSANHDDVQTRAQRAHWRLSWQQRMAANARPSSAPVLTITIYGLPAAFARYVGVSQITAA